MLVLVLCLLFFTAKIDTHIIINSLKAAKMAQLTIVKIKFMEIKPLY